MTDATTSRTITLTLTDQEHDRLQTWTPCTRIRLVPVGEGTARLEIDTRATCAACKGTGRFKPEPGVDMRCGRCRGAGLR